MLGIGKLARLGLVLSAMTWLGCSEVAGPSNEVVHATKPGKAQSPSLVDVVHKGRRVQVAQSAVAAHLAHGDTLPFDGVVVLPGGVKMEFVSVPAGTFTMGSPNTENGRNTNEGPQHEVTISQGFYLGKYEVTQAQWQAVMPTKPWSGKNYVKEGDNYPAHYLSWDNAQDFVQTLNAIAGDVIYRLPTEAEWEYAARAGTTTRWSFGDDENELIDYAWYYVSAWSNGEKYAHEVGTRLPNSWGFYDMHGNVDEWCYDRFSNYPSQPQTDPIGPSTGSLRIFRSGNFTIGARYSRSAYRYPSSHDYSGSYMGFRIVRLAQ
jgi:formylglycine-generating enzyme required for sulfatase activity